MIKTQFEKLCSSGLLWGLRRGLRENRGVRDGILSLTEPECTLYEAVKVLTIEISAGTRYTVTILVKI